MMKILLLENSDAKSIVQWNSKKDADFLQQWAGRGYMFPITEQQIVDRICAEEYSNYKLYKITLDEKMIGTIELMDIDRTTKTAKIGRFLLDSDFVGKGYGTKALTEFLVMIFRDYDLEIIGLTVFSFNKSALRCYRKAGFKTVDEVVRPNGWIAINMEITSSSIRLDWIYVNTLDTKS